MKPSLSDIQQDWKTMLAEHNARSAPGVFMTASLRRTVNFNPTRTQQASEKHLDLSVKHKAIAALYKGSTS